MIKTLKKSDIYPVVADALRYRYYEVHGKSVYVRRKNRALLTAALDSMTRLAIEQYYAIYDESKHS